MKAYLNFQGFTRMIDIPYPMHELKMPIMENVILFTGSPENPEYTYPILTFHRYGELRGGEETIITYKWDGELPRGNQ